MSVDESGIGDREGRAAKRFKIHGILRDALRTKSVGVIEERPDEGLGQVRQAGRRDRVDRADDQPRAHAARHRHLRDQGARRGDLLAAPAHRRRPRTRWSGSCARCMVREGAPADVFQCVEEPSIPLSQELMAICDLTIATGGRGDGQGGVQLRQAGVRRRRRQLDDGDRRDRRHRRGGPQHAAVEDLRLRLRLLGRRQPAHRRPHLRRA